MCICFWFCSVFVYCSYSRLAHIRYLLVICFADIRLLQVFDYCPYSIVVNIRLLPVLNLCPHSIVARIRLLPVFVFPPYSMFAPAESHVNVLSTQNHMSGLKGSLLPWAFCIAHVLFIYSCCLCILCAHSKHLCSKLRLPWDPYHAACRHGSSTKPENWYYLAACSVAVGVRLEGPNDLNADVVRLLLREHREIRTERGEVQSSHLLIKVFT